MIAKIPDWVWTIAAPVGFLALTFFVERILNIRCFTSCEDGPVENFQALIVLAAFFIGASILFKYWQNIPVWVRAWFGFAIAACLYIALEEVSYGQRIFGWTTPKDWGLVNDQNETNLHNASSWLDQKPRAILEMGVYVGGLIIPALQRLKMNILPQRWQLIYPDSKLTITALIALFIRLYDSSTEWLDRQDLFLINRGSELQETYFFWFILLYMLFKRREISISAAHAR